MRLPWQELVRANVLDNVLAIMGTRAALAKSLELALSAVFEPDELSSVLEQSERYNL
jgi:hypothetical protein